MIFKKVSLLALMVSISCGMVSNNDASEKKLVQDTKSMMYTIGNGIIGASLIAPVLGVMKGCERRTLDSMEHAVSKQLDSACQRATFNTMYCKHKMDTRLYTTATGPFTAMIILGVSTRKPAGFVVAGCAALSNYAALFLANHAQRFNKSRYEIAVNAVNLQRSLKDLPQINGDAELSYAQKMFCMGKDSL